MVSASVEFYVVCKVWDSVIETAELRECMRKLTGTAALPSVIIRGAKGGMYAPFAVITRGAHASEEEVICSGLRPADVLAAFRQKHVVMAAKPMAKPSQIEFQTDKDRPGLLADVSALFKSHNVNIKSANVTTHKNAGRIAAKHIYEITDVVSGKDVSQSTFLGLKRGFEKLQVGECPNPVEPVTVKSLESDIELRAKIFELTAQLEKCREDNGRLCIALEEALA